MKEKFTKKLFGKSSPKSWKPPYPAKLKRRKNHHDDLYRGETDG